MRSEVRWQWGTAGLIRVSTDPGGLDLPDDLDLTDPVRCREWEAAVWTSADVRAALATVSPALCTQLDAIAAGSGDRDAVRRAATALASYLLRWQRRATPLAALAGVAAVQIADRAKTRSGTGHRLSLRADALWLGEVTATLHRCPQLVERLKAIANNAVTLRGGRLVAPGQPPIETASAEALMETSVRATGPAKAAMQAAAAPITVADLRLRLAQQYPNAAEDQIAAVLSGLIEQQFLITELHIPLAELDALAAVCRILRAVNAEDIAQVADLVTSLYEICDTLTSAPDFAEVPAGVAEQMTAIAGARRSPLLIDAVADCEATIPEAVAREARDAVDVLYRLSPHMGGTQPWREYQNAFRARYGTGALIPVMDLLADSGLGLPSRYRGTSREHGPQHVSERDTKLLALIQTATLTGGELVLTDQIIEDLASAPLDTRRLPARAEVAFNIRAASCDDIDAGRFILELTGAPRPGGSMAGRHAHLLPKADRDAVAATFGDPGPDTVLAQLSFPPRFRKSQNVARTTVLAMAILPVAEYYDTRQPVIELDDLAVTAEGADLHLIQVSTGRQVVPVVASALEAVTHTPPLARFLSEVATACFPTFGGFAFGAASKLPYLPRVRYHHTILSPARWRLDPDLLPGRDADQQRWDTVFAAWRERWRVPDHVAMVDHDRRQPIDLRNYAHRVLLRSRVQRAGHLELAECAAPQDTAWIGRAHEILLPLTRPAAAPTARRIKMLPPVSDTDTVMIPAVSSVLALRLHAHPERFDEIIADHLPGLTDALEPQGIGWWFHRQRDLTDHRAGQHIALFLRMGEAARFADIAEQAATWARRLHRDHLLSQITITDWQPPTGRYGHGPALNAALGVFAADSAAAVAQLQAARTASIPSQVLAAASYLNLAAGLAGDQPSGRTWLLRQIPHSSGHIDRHLRDQALATADPNGPLLDTPAGHAVAASWGRRTETLSDYAAALSMQRDPIDVLEPLLHLHHLRAVGAWPKAELVTGRLARAIALRQQARTGADR